MERAEQGRALEDHVGAEQEAVGESSTVVKRAAVSAVNQAVSRQRIEQARHPERHLARQAVGLAVSGGYLVRPEICSRCGSPGKIEGHHNSYALEDWLTVEWLCSRCHHERHRKGAPVDRIVNIRFTQSEYDALKVAVGADRNVAPMIRAIVVQVVKTGIEVTS